MSTALPVLEPASIAELVDAIRSVPRVIAVGAGTKPRLTKVAEEFARVSTMRLSGIVEYEPSEFTFTALAGTPLREIVAALAERGQYLPFDPMFVRAGATLGGTVAAGLNGPGRFRYGGVRDFILGVKFVDGEGRLLRAGGKVVKNAAGFDLPKFFVGSAGRFGVLAEVSFKVFPRPIVRRTLRIEAKDLAAKTRALMELAAGRWEFDALDAAIEEPAVYARLAGPPAALEALGADVLARWPGDALTSGEGDYFWESVTEGRWAHSGGTLARVALTPAQIEQFAVCVRSQASARGWISAGGNAGFFSMPAGAMLPELPWAGVTLRGEGPLWLGPQKRFEVMQRVKTALDPHDRFPGLEET